MLAHGFSAQMWLWVCKRWGMRGCLFNFSWFEWPWSWSWCRIWGVGCFLHCVILSIRLSKKFSSKQNFILHYINVWQMSSVNTRVCVQTFLSWSMIGPPELCSSSMSTLPALNHKKKYLMPLPSHIFGWHSVSLS